MTPQSPCTFRLTCCIADYQLYLQIYQQYGRQGSSRVRGNLLQCRHHTTSNALHGLNLKLREPQMTKLLAGKQQGHATLEPSSVRQEWAWRAWWLLPTIGGTNTLTSRTTTCPAWSWWTGRNVDVFGIPNINLPSLSMSWSLSGSLKVLELLASGKDYRIGLQGGLGHFCSLLECFTTYDQEGLFKWISALGLVSPVDQANAGFKPHVWISR